MYEGFNFCKILKFHEVFSYFTVILKMFLITSHDTSESPSASSSKQNKLQSINVCFCQEKQNIFQYADTSIMTCQ